MAEIIADFLCSLRKTQPQNTESKSKNDQVINLNRQT
jgi:hypothetical protein